MCTYTSPPGEALWPPGDGRSGTSGWVASGAYCGMSFVKERCTVLWGLGWTILFAFHGLNHLQPASSKKKPRILKSSLETNHPSVSQKPQLMDRSGLSSPGNGTAPCSSPSSLLLRRLIPVPGIVSNICLWLWLQLPSAAQRSPRRHQH